MTATYRKMPDSSWAVMSDARHDAGSNVVVALRSGATKNVVLGDLIYSTDDKYVYAISADKTLASRAAPQEASVGDLSGIISLFDKAKQHLKYPAIVMSVPAADTAVRINVAGQRAKQPGSLNVCSVEKTKDGNFGPEREWYGRVQTDGKFVASRACGDMFNAISDRLKAFADAPAAIASEHGRLTGCCCFCNKALTDERSTAVGYGKICAGHFGLPWGSR